MRPQPASRDSLIARQGLTARTAHIAGIARTGLIGALAAAVLSGCGGGGVEIDLPLLLPFGSLTASATSCSVQRGQTSCEVLLFAVSSNAVSISLRDSQGNGFSVQLNQNNVLTVRVPLGGATFTFNYGGSNDAVISIQASCANGLVFNGQTCELRL